MVKMGNSFLRIFGSMRDVAISWRKLERGEVRMMENGGRIWFWRRPMRLR